MIVVERTLAVTAAPGAVLGYLTDFAHHQQWDPGTERTTREDSGPLGPGARWHHVRRVFGVTAELTYTLVEAGADRLVFHGRNEGATCVDTIVVRPAGAGAEVTYRIELEMHGLAKLATPMLKVEFEKLGGEGAARLTAALEALAAPPAVEAQTDGPPRVTEIRFDGPPRTTAPPRGREAQA